MATIEERLTALEQENAALKKAVELQMIALRAMVTKDAFEGLCDTNDKIFGTLINHDQLTNERLGDQQTQIIELDGKVVGLQTEMRQSFKDAQTQITNLDGKVAGLQTEMRQRFNAIDGRFEAIDKRFEAQDKRLDRLEMMLAQILARLPEKS